MKENKIPTRVTLKITGASSSAFYAAPNVTRTWENTKLCQSFYELMTLCAIWITCEIVLQWPRKGSASSSSLGTLSKCLIRIISLALGWAGLLKAVQGHKGEEPDPALEFGAEFCGLLPILEILAVVESPNSALCGCRLLWSCPSPFRISWNGWEGFAGITRQEAQAWKVALQNSGSWSRGAPPSCKDRKAQRNPSCWKTGNTGMLQVEDIFSWFTHQFFCNNWALPRVSPCNPNTFIH